MSKQKNTNKETKATIETKATVTTLSFAEKLQDSNTYLETLRLNCEIAKKVKALDELSKKDDLTEDDKEKIEKLSFEKLQLETVKKDFVATVGKSKTLEEITTDKFAFICAWAINPQKGNSYKENDTLHFDIAFNGMFKVCEKIKAYYNNYFDAKDSKEKTDARKDLVATLNEFVNQYLPHDKTETQLTPCKNETVSLTFARYIKDTTTLTTRDFAMPKNCMKDGYKPMNVRFVDTDTKPMLKDLIATCQGRLKWTKNGINKGKVDNYAIIQQVFLTALKYNLDFEIVKTVTVKSTNII